MSSAQAKLFKDIKQDDYIGIKKTRVRKQIVTKKHESIDDNSYKDNLKVNDSIHVSEN